MVPHRGSASSARPQPTGHVLFVDDADWDCFFQLSVALRRAGHRTIRVTTAQPRRTSVAMQLIFDEVHVLGSTHELSGLADIVGDRYLLDVQVVDSLAARVYAEVATLPESLRSDHWRRRDHAVDKWLVGQSLRAAGLQVPDSLTVDGVTAAEAVQQLGLPIVLKDRMGSGGSGVSIHHTLASLQAAVSQGAPAAGGAGPADQRFFERHVAGRSLQFGCVAVGDGVAQFVTYETLARIRPLAPASRIQLLEDRSLAETGVRLVNALQISGYLNVNVIRDSAGTDWVHDVNPRVWGSFVAFTDAGIDLVGSYLRWLAGEAEPAHGRAPDIGRRMWVIPCGLDEALQQSPTVIGAWRIFRPYLSRLGPRYALFELLRQRRLLARHVRPRLGTPAAVAVGE